MQPLDDGCEVNPVPAGCLSCPLPFCSGPDWQPRRSAHQLGVCGACGKPLEGRALWFCRGKPGDPESCRRRYLRNHDWGDARAEALRRTGGRCSRDATHQGGMEVNHIAPRRGAGYGIGCWNHQDNLEPLCHGCHQDVTADQRAEYTTTGPRTPIEIRPTLFGPMVFKRRS